MFRDSQVVIIDVERVSIKAGIGLQELLKAPSVEIAARVGLRRTAGLSNGALNGSSSKHPFTDKSNGYSNGAHRVSEYLVGHHLDAALDAGEEIDIFWPFQNGTIGDWTQAEALWKYILFTKLGLRRSQNESPVLLCVPASLSRRTHERLTQVFFERLNVAGFSIIERPLAQLYAANSVYGVVVDISRDATDITPIIESQIQHSCRVTLDVGTRDCELHLATMLRSNQPLMKAISPPENPLPPEALSEFLISLARHIWKDGLVKVPLAGELAPQEDEGVTDIAAVLVAGKEKAVIENNLKKKLSAKATAAERERAREIEAMDLIQTQFRGVTVTLGKERHRFCDPLFDPVLRSRLRGISHEGAISIPEAVALAIRGVDVDYRTKAYDGMFVTGEISSLVKGIGPALQLFLSASYIVANTETNSEVQPRSIRVLKVPEYFANYRDQGDGVASFLGTSIIAKMIFSEQSSQTYVTKPDYIKHGPRAIVELCPVL